MRISLLGGTGDIGEALALRWAYDTHHEVVIGSRDPERARTKAEEYETELRSRDVDRKVTGFANGMAADRGDVVVLAVPPYQVAELVESVAEKLSDTVLVSPAVGMSRDEEGLHYNPPDVGSVTQLVDAVAPEGVPVVGAFHALSADRLANLDLAVDIDTVLVGDDPDAKDQVARLTTDIEGVRPLDGGGLANAPEVEAMTPLLVNLGTYNDGLHDAGVKFQ
ncbi:NADPH-dependent F420 reductase [Halanaeroarchaeum sulfurireducens]|uniref:NADPH-dependent F420 reductase n=1 Tax=Halanaeroarchaeum sulfurireducens TaxID=1604004 RepID=A0A0F7P9M5_9EURY|nr:NADPH-dependent F420 reductase [Halanaeroarchaeum sulfurireducens]AKH96910.1 NADPH-dependent F420 reductase [Halanaeroarchaeum sulfurireducens]ALG81312.1 NADPH-dependent F420 reductase [Halanaeroarchaeum sulfurireducens]